MGRNGLTAKQAVFVREYLVDLNATQAAIRAGYSAKTADRIGPELLGKTCVVEAISKAQTEREKRTQVTQDMVVAELAKIAFGDARDVMTWGPRGVTLRDSTGLSGAQAASVAEVSETTTKDGGSLRLKRHDKVKALELLGKHLGMFTDVNVHLNEAPRLELVLQGAEALEQDALPRGRAGAKQDDGEPEHESKQDKDERR